MNKIPGLRGFVEIELLDAQTDEIVSREVNEIDIENLVVNLFREYLPRLIAPKIVTGRGDNLEGLGSWMDRRVALIGFGVGDNGTPTPAVKPEDPEDGRTLLNGTDASYPNSKLGLQGPIRRLPLGVGASEVNLPASAAPDPNADINGYYLLKEVDADGVTISQTELGGSELAMTFTVEEDEYIGNILEYGLFLGGGDSANDALFDIGDGSFDRTRLSRNSAIMIARKTRNRPIEKTRDFKFRATWRLRA